MATRTYRMIRTRLKSVFQEAVNDPLIFVNPVASVKPIKLRPDEEKDVGTALDFDQAAHLQEFGGALHAAGVYRQWPAILTTVSIGLRYGKTLTSPVAC